MSEEDQDKAFRGQGNICAPAIPAPVLVMLYMQQQAMQSCQQTVRTMMKFNPYMQLLTK